MPFLGKEEFITVFVEGAKRQKTLSYYGDLVSAHWYSNDWRGRRLMCDIAKIRVLVPALGLPRLRRGAIAYQFKADSSGKINVLIVCPPKYPRNALRGIITFDSEGLEIPLQFLKNWSSHTNIQNVVEEASKILEEEGSASNLKKSKGADPSKL